MDRDDRQAETHPRPDWCEPRRWHRGYTLHRDPSGGWWAYPMPSALGLERDAMIWDGVQALYPSRQDLMAAIDETYRDPV